jgi:hypothetical protein
MSVYTQVAVTHLVHADLHVGARAQRREAGDMYTHGLAVANQLLLDEVGVQLHLGVTGLLLVLLLLFFVCRCFVCVCG